MDDALTKEFETHYKAMVRFDKFLGMDLQVQAPGQVSYELEVTENHISVPDSAHGGVAAAMMDATLGVAALSYAVQKGNLVGTVEFKINYLKPAQLGHTLVSNGRVKHAGKRLVVSEGEIRDKESGDLIAMGMGTFSQYPIQKRSELIKESEGETP